MLANELFKFYFEQRTGAGVYFFYIIGKCIVF